MKPAFWAPGIALALVLTSTSAMEKNRKKAPAEVGRIALGRQLAEEVRRQANVVTDPIIMEYVNGIAQNLLHNVSPNIPVTIEVVDSEDQNTFTLLGGLVFIDSNAILKAHSEAELARLIAYQLAVACAQGTCPPSRSRIVEHRYVFRKADFLVVKSRVLALRGIPANQTDSDRPR